MKREIIITRIGKSRFDIKIPMLDIWTHAISLSDCTTAINEALECTRLAAIEFNCKKTLNLLNKFL